MNVQVLSNSMLKKARNIDYLVNCPAFLKLYYSLKDQEKDIIDHLILNVQEEQLKLWFSKYKSRNIHLMTVKQLRELASSNKIPDYNLLTKKELIDELKRKNARTYP